MRRTYSAIFALVISLAAGLWVRTLQAPDDSCTVAALDAVLSGGELVLNDDCVLMLDSERVVTGRVTITGGMLHGGGLQRVLRVAAGANLTLREVEIRVGTAEMVPADGGAIYNEGTVALIDSHLKGNRARRGGAIFNSGTLTIVRSQLDHNTAKAEGGAIYNTGTLSADDSIIAGNMATLDGNGIVNDGGTVDVRNNYWGYPNGPRDGTLVGITPEQYTPWLRNLPDWARG